MIRAYNGALYWNKHFLFRYRCRTYSELYKMSYWEMMDDKELPDWHPHKISADHEARKLEIIELIEYYKSFQSRGWELVVEGLEGLLE